MATGVLTAETFEQTVTGDGIVLVDFWASWCGPCRRFAPASERASGEHPDVVFAKVDTEAEPALAGVLNTSSIPMLMAFRDGVPVFSQPDAVPGPAQPPSRSLAAPAVSTWTTSTPGSPGKSADCGGSGLAFGRSGPPKLIPRGVS